MVICLGFNLSEGKGLGPYIQSGQIQGRQQLTSPTLAEPGYFCGKSETYGIRAVSGVSASALLSSAFFSRAIEYFCIKDFINLVVRKGSEISNDPWRTGI